MQEKIVVIYGGRSYEHDVSIITGLQALSNTNIYKYGEPLPIYIDKDGVWYTGENLKSIDTYGANFCKKRLKQVFVKSGSDNLYCAKKGKAIAKIKCAVVCAHGGEGEDGTLSAILEASNIKKTCAPILGSAVCMSKTAAKMALSYLSLPVLPQVHLDNINYPVIIKPDCLGSSIGINTANNKEELDKAIGLCETMGENSLIEPLLTDFCEYNIAAFENSEKQIILSKIEKIEKKGTFSFNDKYINGAMTSTNEQISDDDVLSIQIKDLATKIYQNFWLGGIVRIDFLFDKKTQKLYVNEINTIPGSLAFYLFKHKYSFSALIDEQIKKALFDTTKSTKIFDSKILETFKKSVGKKR